MATKFSKNITKTNAYETRKVAIEQKAKIATESIVNALKSQRANIELRIADLLDFAPETADSMRPGTPNWDAQQWAVDLQNLSVERDEVKRQLEIAENTYNEYFTEVED